MSVICFTSSREHFLTQLSFQFGNRQFWVSSRKSRDCAETYALYVAQENPQIDAEIAQKGHFRMETNWKTEVGGTGSLFYSFSDDAVSLINTLPEAAKKIRLARFKEQGIFIHSQKEV